MLVIQDVIQLDKYELYKNTRGPSAVQNTAQYATSSILRICTSLFSTSALIIDVIFLNWFLDELGSSSGSYSGVGQYGNIVSHAPNIVMI